MVDAESIQEAGARVAEPQEILAVVQSGLQRIEQVAVAAEQAEATAKRALKVTVAVVGVSVVLIGLTYRRPAR